MLFQAIFFVTPQIFFIKPNIFFHKPPKTLNLCIFLIAIRYLWLKYLGKIFGKILAWINLATGKFEELQNYNALSNRKAKLEFKLPWTIIFLSLLLPSSFWSSFKVVFINIAWTKIHTRKSIHTNTKNN